MGRKQGLVVGGGVLVVGAYVAGSWALGRAANAQFEQMEQQLAQQPVPVLTIAERKYSPGIFSSEQLVTFELDRNLWNAIKGPGAADDDSEYPIDAELSDEEAASMQQAMNELKGLESLLEDSGPWRFTIKNEVQHGPLPGFTSFGLARIKSTLVLEDATRAKVAAILGDREPVVIDSLIGFAGGGRVNVSSPGFELKGEDDTLTWQGIEGRFTHGRNVSALTCDVRAPGLDITLAEHGTFQFGAMQMQCDLKHAFSEHLYVGTSSMSMDGLRASFASGGPPLTIEKFRYSGDANVNGEYVDVAVSFGIGSFQMPQITINDVQYDLAVKHLHGPTYAKLMKTFEEVGTPSSAMSAADPMAVMNAVMDDALLLLEHSPQLVLNKFGFSMPEGEMAITGNIHLTDFDKAELQNAGSPFAVLSKIDATADVWFTQGLLERDWSNGASESEEEEGALTPEERRAALLHQIAQMEEMGYLTRKNDRLESRIEFKGGMLTANGKPFGPGMQ